MTHIDSAIEVELAKLCRHPLYFGIQTPEHLRIFMNHHVYCVWDFMSLLKFLQQQFCPSQVPWSPRKNSDVARFINEIVVGEETDVDLEGNYNSHFEMYCMAMKEVDADYQRPMDFSLSVVDRGLSASFERYQVPVACREFVETTFSFIRPDKPHLAAAAFALGREKMIPPMFQELLDRFGVTKKEAPHFHYYIERHIEVDGDSHGPLSLKMLEVLCDSEEKWQEVNRVALACIDARSRLWDQVCEALVS
jgi:hypothetical protein